MGSVVTTYSHTILDQIVGTDAPYLALFTSSPGDTGDKTGEVDGASTTYGRQDLADANDKWENAGGSSNREVNTDKDIQFPICGSTSWGTVTHLALCAAGTHDVADLKVWGALTTSKPISENDQLVFSAGNITLTVAAG